MSAGGEEQQAKMTGALGTMQPPDEPESLTALSLEELQQVSGRLEAIRREQEKAKPADDSAADKARHKLEKQLGRVEVLVLQALEKLTEAHAGERLIAERQRRLQDGLQLGRLAPVPQLAEIGVAQDGHLEVGCVSQELAKRFQPEAIFPACKLLGIADVVHQSFQSSILPFHHQETAFRACKQLRKDGAAPAERFGGRTAHPCDLSEGVVVDTDVALLEARRMQVRCRSWRRWTSSRKVPDELETGRHGRAELTPVGAAHQHANGISFYCPLPKRLGD
eukprot:scaffold2129_cov255-Pinguiococcus_pyrenoidosus.AAC.10